MKIDWSFRPKLADTLKNYSRQDLVADLIAGLTVGIVALPLAMGFGIASGVTPQTGIFTAVVAGFIISALGGSRVQVGRSPTGAGSSASSSASSRFTDWRTCIFAR